MVLILSWKKGVIKGSWEIGCPRGVTTHETHYLRQVGGRQNLKGITEKNRRGAVAPNLEYTKETGEEFQEKLSS